MNEQAILLTIGGLVHDLGKIAYRAGAKESHSVLGEKLLKEALGDERLEECIRYHHKKDLNAANLADNSLAYIIYLANNIALAKGDKGTDLNEGMNLKNSDKGLPLSAVFNILNNHNFKHVYEGRNITKEINLPLDNRDYKIESNYYREIWQKIESELEKMTISQDGINSLLAVLESCLSYLPADIAVNQITDISLYDHLKITAAIAVCIWEYLQDKELNDYKKTLLDKEKEFYNRKVFLLFSCDFSGIQKFIYNIKTEKALKSLRARSFFLEIFLEQLVDEILDKTDVSRANLLYTGGGHCYILLPNTEENRKALDDFKIRINQWLRENFGINLYLASAYQECSANSLINNPIDKEPYKKIYRTLSRDLSGQKLKRYNAEEIRELNKGAWNNTGRECKICGGIDNLGEKDICSWCSAFADFGGELVKEKDFILITQEKIEQRNALKLPAMEGDNYLQLAQKEEIEELRKRYQVKRLYSKNRTVISGGGANIYLGDYCYDSVLENLADDSDGIKRIGVLRADVDNLGTAFTSGFANKYLNIARTTAFSRQMSLFFKFYINSLLDGGEEQFRISSKQEKNSPRKAVIVYSGGDDLFLVGAWGEIIETAIDINQAFGKFTLGTLSISAGIGIFGIKYPIYKTAYYTAELEEKAKKTDGKNAVALFTTEEDHTYKWSDFLNKVLKEKFSLLERFFEQSFSDEEEKRGKAFLYKLLDYLKNSEDKINIARYLYLLARLEPKNENSLYKEFSEKMYEWIFGETDRKELITAIYIYLYSVRKRSEK